MHSHEAATEYPLYRAPCGSSTHTESTLGNTSYESKTKALISCASCAVTVQLICAFNYAYMQKRSLLSPEARKHVFRVSAQVGDKPACTDMGDGKRLKSSYMLCSAHQLPVTAPVFALYAKTFFF